MQIADRVRIARELSGLSARRVSHLAGLAPSHVALIERGGTDVSANTAASLAGVLGCSLDWLVRGVGRPPSRRTVRRAVDKAVENDTPPA
jgi:transcriptional regulator with XRE-family HTH domain